MILPIFLYVAASAPPEMQGCYDYQEMGVGGDIEFTGEGEKRCWRGHPTSNSFILYPNSDDYVVQIALSPKGEDDWTVYDAVTAPRQIIVEGKYDLAYAIRANKPMKLYFVLIPQSRTEEKNGIVTHYKSSFTTNTTAEATLTIYQEEIDGKVHRYTDEIAIINPNRQALSITKTKSDPEVKLTQRNVLDPTTINQEDQMQKLYGNIIALTLTTNTGKVDKKSAAIKSECQDPKCADIKTYPPISSNVEEKTYFVSKDGQTQGSFTVGDDDGDGLSGGEIAAIVICVIIVVVVVIVLCVYFLIIKPKKNGDGKKKSSSSSSSSKK